MSQGVLGEKDSPYVLGIDLGTSTSICSVYRRGRGETITIFGDRIVPSVVNYPDGADPLVGRQAKGRAMIDPENTVVSIKRDMGNPDYKREIRGKPIQPEDVSALILEHMKNGAQEHEDLLGTIKYAIVTVPANFNNNQRQATMKAAEAAGLTVLQLIEEPVAAAVAYGYNHDRDQTILVYDLGGGTFDVCVLKVEAAKGGASAFKVLGKAGVPELGGDDFDAVLMKMLAQKIVGDGGPDLLDQKKDQGVSKKKLRAALQTLKEKAEAAKIELSDADSADVDCPALIKDESGKEFHLSTTITRAQFEEAIKPLVDRTKECICQALAEAKVSVEEIDRMILVGASTRPPCIRKMVTEMFGKEPYGDIDPATAVSVGAAILGATFELPGRPDVDTIKPDELKKEVTTSHFLGIETVGQKFTMLIAKNTTFPCQNAKPFTTAQDNAPEVRFAVFQFPKETEDIDMKIEGAACLGEFHFGPLDPAPKGTILIDVTFAIDESGMLNVTAAGKGMTKKFSIKVT